MSPAALKKTTHRPIVILIEDDNRLAPALAMLIEDWGYECLAVRTPEAAAQHLGSAMGDAIAIVADLSRDDAYTGRRSAEAISEALGADLPRIVTTNEPAMARANGFDDVLSKPYDPEDLRRWLALAHARRSAGG